MFTRWQQVENWIRDNGLNSWRFSFDKTGTQVDGDGNSTQNRSNRIAVLSDALPGDLEEKIALTRRRLMDEANQTLYGYGKRGKENTGQMYCEVRLVDEFQQPSTQSVSSPAYPPLDEEKIAERIRKEVRQELELQRYQDERKAFEAEKKEFEDEKRSAIGMLVHYMSPVVSAMIGKNVAGIDATSPVHAPAVQPIHASDQDSTQTFDDEEIVDDVFTDDEYNKLFELMARFKAAEPRYLELIENVVTMAENGDNTYTMARGFLLK